jgi:leucyl aminopeptidase
MEYSCKLGDPEKLKSACLVVGVFKNNHLTAPGQALDAAIGGQIKAVLDRHDFNAEIGQTQMLYEPRNCAAARIL